MLLEFVRAHDPFYSFDFLGPLLCLNLLLNHQIILTFLALLSKLVLFDLALSFDALLARFFLLAVQVADFGAMAVFLLLF
jgi:hypothetical protein